jgi:hypothetical protein
MPIPLKPPSRRMPIEIPRTTEHKFYSHENEYIESLRVPIPTGNILPLKPNIEGLTPEQTESVRLLRATQKFYNDGIEKAREHLPDHTILEEHSGDTWTTTRNQRGEVEINIRGIDPKNSADLEDLKNITLYPERSETLRGVMRVINSLPEPPVRINGFSRGGSAGLLINKYTGIDVRVFNPALSAKSLHLPETNYSEVELIRTTGDFASIGAGLRIPKHWDTHIIEPREGYKDNTVFQHLLGNFEGREEVDYHPINKPKPEIDYRGSASGVTGLASFGLGMTELITNIQGKKPSRGVEASAEAVGNAQGMMDAPEFTAVGSSANDVVYFLDRFGVTNWLKTDERKQEEEEIDFFNTVHENSNRTESFLPTPQTTTVTKKETKQHMEEIQDTNKKQIVSHIVIDSEGRECFYLNGKLKCEG